MGVNGEDESSGQATEGASKPRQQAPAPWVSAWDTDVCFYVFFLLHPLHADFSLLQPTSAALLWGHSKNKTLLFIHLWSGNYPLENII